MATRNLTKAFSQARNGGKANRSILKSEGQLNQGTSDSDQHSDSGLLTADGETWKAIPGNSPHKGPVGGVHDTLPPQWVDSLDKAEECIEAINKGIRDLSTLHRQRLMVNFEANEDEQERQINFKTGDVTELFRQTESILKKIGRQGDEHLISDGERTVRKNMQSQLAKKLQGLSMTFRTSQKMYLKKVQAQKSGAGDIAFDYLEDSKTSSSSTSSSVGASGGNRGSGGMSSTELDLLETGGAASLNIGLGGFNASQMQIVNDMEETVNQRDAEIVAIAKSIEELAQIFKELAVLVIDQGTILDRIDYNMEVAVDHAKEGVLELEKAEEHQKGATPVKCISFLVVGIVICLIILINRWKN